MTVKSLRFMWLHLQALPKVCYEPLLLHLERLAQPLKQRCSLILFITATAFKQAPEVLPCLNVQVEEGAEVEDEVGGEAGVGAEASQKMRRTLLLLSRTHLLLSQQSATSKS